MALLTILQEGHSLLCLVAEDVTEFGPDLDRLVADMAETMTHADGIGLAAPQVGQSYRLILVALDGPKLPPMAMVNPVITKAEDYCDSLEGCLSVQFGKREGRVRRRKRIKVTYLDTQGTPRKLKTNGWRAACVQHEIDHLDGILFTDYLPKRTGLPTRWPE
jgi:peptide deformylase